jgi:hypothetical protein
MTAEVAAAVIAEPTRIDPEMTTEGSAEEGMTGYVGPPSRLGGELRGPRPLFAVEELEIAGGNVLPGEGDGPHVDGADLHGSIGHRPPS